LQAAQLLWRCSLAWAVATFSAQGWAASPADACPKGVESAVPSGQSGDDIQFAIRKVGPGGLVLLKGEYEVEDTISLRSGVTLCSESGATLVWSNPRRAGMMITAMNASNTTIKNLILDGRGIMVKGRGHVIENNLIRNILTAHSSAKRWSESHAVMVADVGEGVAIRNNLFTNVVDTAIMAYGLDHATITGNQFTNASEGIHLWSATNTLVSQNKGSGFKAMSIEIQGDDRPGLVIEDNTFRDWHKDHVKGAYAMSVVSGIGALVRRNQIIGSPLMGAGLEVGGQAPVISANVLSDASIVITGSPDAMIVGNQVTRAAIFKDINRASKGSLTIKDNVITDAPLGAIMADHWWGHDTVLITGNIIRKTIQTPNSDFHAIYTPDFNKQPVQIIGNKITIKALPGVKAGLTSCFMNGGYLGNLKGMLIKDNECDGGGVAMFVHSNSLGGHDGVQYQGNKLSNLTESINGDTKGLLSIGNTLSNVSRDSANLKSSR
jgi:parallel beta-helix repeat protein